MNKKIRVLIVTLFLFLLSGCSIEYNLNFVDNNLVEDINVNLNGNDYTVDKIEGLKSFKLLAISKGLDQIEYNSKYNDLSNAFNANYTYTYSVNNFSKNNVLSRCYDSFALTTSDDYYLLSTGKNFKCLIIEYQKVDDYKISITTNHKVLDNNADEVDGNTYIWKITNTTDNESTQKPIMIKFSKYTTSNNSNINNNVFTIFIVLFAILIIGGIIILVIYNKGKNNNKI